MMDYDKLCYPKIEMSQTVSTGNSHIPDPYAVYADSFDLSLLPSSNLSLSSVAPTTTTSVLSPISSSSSSSSSLASSPSLSLTSTSTLNDGEIPLSPLSTISTQSQSSLLTSLDYIPTTIYPDQLIKLEKPWIQEDTKNNVVNENNINITASLSVCDNNNSAITTATTASPTIKVPQIQTTDTSIFLQQFQKQYQFYPSPLPSPQQESSILSSSTFSTSSSSSSPPLSGIIYPPSPCPSIEQNFQNFTIKQEVHILPPSPPESNGAPSPAACNDIKSEPEIASDTSSEVTLIGINTLWEKSVNSSFENHQQTLTSIVPSSSSPSSSTPLMTTVSTQHQKQPEQNKKPTQDHQLLREYLQDTSFQKKHNLKPLALESLIGGLGVRGDIEPVISLALEYAKRDAQATCALLKISPDPQQWTTAQVHAWIRSTIEQFKLPQINDIEMKFPENGSALMLLSEDEFNSRVPEAGGTIHAQLEIWKLACTENFSCDLGQQQQNHHQQGTTSNLTWNTTECPQNMNISDDEDEEMHPLPTSSIATAVSSSSSSSCMHNNNLNDGSTLLSLCNMPSSLSSSSSSSCSIPSSMPNGGGLNNTTTMATGMSNVNGLLAKPASTTMSISSSVTSGSSIVSSPTTTVAAATTSAIQKTGARPGGSHIHLWQFLKELLSTPQLHGTAIRWLDRNKGVFKIEDSVRVAKLWGRRKNRPAMNYDKLSRSIRQYYKKGIMKKTERSQRLVYQFCHPYSL